MEPDFLKRIGHSGPQDFPEDGPENIYACRCVTCKGMFWGYKARMTCKVCETAYASERAAMTPEELEQHDAEKMAEFIQAAKALNIID